MAVLFGPGDDGEPTADDWAEAVGTINYEIVTRMGSARVPRVYDGGTSRTVAHEHRRCTTAAPGGRARGAARPASSATIVGAAAAGVAAGVAAERLLLAQARRSTDRDPYVDEPFGELAADEYRTVTTDEGIPLHVEIDGDRPRRR